jgi:hypothetical protein
MILFVNGSNFTEIEKHQAAQAVQFEPVRECHVLGVFFTYNLEEGKPAGAVADQRNRDQQDSVCDIAAEVEDD